jgi:TetR/AcrR family transcriptional regulator
MPKPTFFNLDEQKRQMIIQACIDEFALQPFSSASINQIIKQANISRGSFYQYFEDKEDCYMFLLSEVAKIKMDLLKNASLKYQANGFFDNLQVMIEQTLTWIEQEPKLYAIGVLMEYDNSDFIQKLVAKNAQSVDFLKSLVNKDIEQGRIRQDIDVDLLVQMLLSVNRDILMTAYRERDFEKVKYQFKQVLNILKEGAQHVSS